MSQTKSDRVYKVCIPHTGRDFYDYLADEHDAFHIGARVWVPFRHHHRVGIIVAVGNQENPDIKLRCIIDLIDHAPLLPPTLLSLCRWVSTYYQSPLSEVLPLALPKHYRHGTSSEWPKEPYYQLKVAPEIAYAKISKRAVRQHDLVRFFAEHQIALSRKSILNAGFKSAQIQGLNQLGLLNQTEQTVLFSFLNPSEYEQATPEKPLVLSSEQAHAVSKINDKPDAYHCYLLQGITGSGKTEVYLQVIANVLAAGKQALVLVPEIGLTPQLLARFKARFCIPVVSIHSHLNDRERQIAWQLASEEKVKLIIGTRTAVFTPLPALGLIVIDEEHDASFKQMEGVRYSARDTAVVRAQAANIPIILGSATPSLESLYNCVHDKSTLLTLTQKALNATPLHYQILDIRNQPLQQGLARPALQLIEQHLNQNNQVLVFINRRGFAPVLLCHQCGWMADCRACDSHLTLHRRLDKLICHHCGLMQPIPNKCQQCEGRELLPIGAGTQRIHEFLTQQFPETSVLRIDRDEIGQKNALSERLERISTGEAQLIVGTQMLAKGHHFPRLTLVIVLDADNGFYNQDFRALERLGQLLTQVSGRAGRAEHAGQVLIQTHMPQHPLLNVLIQEGYDKFANALMQTRKQAQLPPFHYLAVIRAQGRHLPKVLDFLHAVKKLLQEHVSTLGPAPAPLARKAGQHRMQLLVKSPSRKRLQAALTMMRKQLLTPQYNGVRWNIDVDPADLS